MSVRVSSAVWEVSRATGSARLVLLALADHAGDDGRAWPSVARLARMTLLDRRNVQRALVRLVEAGEIVVVGTAQRGVTIYRITPGSTTQPAAEAPQVNPTTCGRGAAGQADETPQSCGATAAGETMRPAAEAPRRRRRRSGAGGARPAALVTRPAALPPPEPYEPPLEPSEEAAAEQAAFELWNALCESTGLKPVTRLTSERRKLLTARLAECGGPDGWAAALLKIDQTPGLRGQGSRGFCVKFDWLLKETNFAKLMEGFYDGWDPSRPANGGGTGKKSGPQDRQLAGLFAAVEGAEARRRHGK